MQKQAQAEAYRRRAKSRYKNLCSQRSFIDILLCESLVCVLFAAAILYFKHTQNGIYNDILLYVESVKAFSPKGFFAYIVQFFKKCFALS